MPCNAIHPCASIVSPVKRVAGYFGLAMDWQGRLERSHGKETTFAKEMPVLRGTIHAQAQVAEILFFVLRLDGMGQGSSEGKEGTMRDADAMKSDAKANTPTGTACDHVYTGKAVVRVDAKGNVSDPLLLQWEIEERRMAAMVTALDKILPGVKP